MDTSDQSIVFDNNGMCDHCLDFYNNTLPKWHTNERGVKELINLAEKIKKERSNKDFDCILGMSGGVDSSFLLHYVVTELRLKPLVFHVDGGWNSELAVNNIHVMIDKLGLDLFTGPYQRYSKKIWLKWNENISIQSNLET